MITVEREPLCYLHGNFEGKAIVERFSDGKQNPDCCLCKYK